MFSKYLLALALILATTVNASASITRTHVEDYSVEPGANVEVKIGGGPISVKVGSSGKVHVELIAVVNADSANEADELIAKAQPTIEQKGQRIRVTVQPENFSFSWLWWHRERGAHFKVNLIVPPAINLDLDTSGGPIKVDGEVQGEVHVNTSGGPISVTGATGKLRSGYVGWQHFRGSRDPANSRRHFGWQYQYRLCQPQCSGCKRGYLRR